MKPNVLIASVLTPAGRHVVSYGTFSTSDARPVTSDSVFEIGSVTNVFTSSAIDRSGPSIRVHCLPGLSEMC